MTQRRSRHSMLFRRDALNFLPRWLEPCIGQSSTEKVIWGILEDKAFRGSFFADLLQSIDGVSWSRKARSYKYWYHILIVFILEIHNGETSQVVRGMSLPVERCKDCVQNIFLKSSSSVTLPILGLRFPISVFKHHLLKQHIMWTREMALDIFKIPIWCKSIGHRLLIEDGNCE